MDFEPIIFNMPPLVNISDVHIDRIMLSIMKGELIWEELDKNTKKRLDDSGYISMEYGIDAWKMCLFYEKNYILWKDICQHIKNMMIDEEHATEDGSTIRYVLIPYKFEWINK